MNYAGATVVHQIDLTNPVRRIDITVRDDGAFQAFENLAIENDPAKGWTPYRVSGIYQDAHQAEFAARKMWETFDFSGMTVNERLFCIAALAEFDQARKIRDRPRLIAILTRVGLHGQASEILEKL